MATKPKSPPTPKWAVIRIPRALYERIRAGQGTTLHETISRALDAREDPKAERRLREAKAEHARELAVLRAEIVSLNKKLALLGSDAAARTLPLFPKDLATALWTANGAPVPPGFRRR